MNIEHQIDILLKQKAWTPHLNHVEVVPDYLQQTYARESAAAWLGELSSPTVTAIAALIRAAMTDEEETVRERALRSVRNFVEQGHVSKRDGVSILTSATYDTSSKVRCTGLEGIWAIDESSARECAKRLSEDVDWLVAETARNILSSE